MKTMANWLVAVMLMMAGAGVARAEHDGARLQAPVAKKAGWERVGEAGAASLAAPAARQYAPGESSLQARKAEMVRRLFWIALAHR